jgi:hypothetical protein
MLSRFLVLSKIPPFFHAIYMIECLLQKSQGNMISGYTFFRRNKKKKFIPFPWRIGYFIFRYINKIDEFANNFHNMNLKYVENIKGFDPNEIFVEHMLSVRLKNSFFHNVIGEEEDNKLDSPTHNVGYLETILNTNEFYKHRRKGPSEKSA